MRVLVIADVEEPWLTTAYDYDRMKGVELILSCGDLPAGYLEHVVTLANVPLLYVPGNHDRAYERHAPEGCQSVDGCIREACGLRVMGLGGSMRYNDRVYGFTENEMRRRAIRLALQAKFTGGVDIVVTHVPPYGHGDLDDMPHRGFDAFNTVIEMLHPRYLVHGHIHMEYGRIERRRVHPAGTKLVNACGAQFIEV